MVDLRKSQMRESQMKKSRIFAKLSKAQYNTLILSLSFQYSVKNNIVPE